MGRAAAGVLGLGGDLVDSGALELAAGFQLFLSADICPWTAAPSAVVIFTFVSEPLLTVTAAALLMLALSEPFFGAILISASDVFLAAASSTAACDFVPPPSAPRASLPPPLHAESTSTPPTRADAAIRPLRRLLSVITRISIVADFPTTPKALRAPIPAERESP